MSERALKFSPTARSRLFMLSIIALFLAPLLVAWLLVGRWQPPGTVHHGQLLNPARPVTHLRVDTAQGRVLDPGVLRGRWTLAYLAADARCLPDCRAALHAMRQLHLALGRDLARVQRLLLLPEAPDAALQDWLARAHGDLTAGAVDAETRRFFATAFPDAPAQGLYLIDPLGNLVLRYGPDTDPRDILKDLGRLLKISKIG